MDPWSKVDYSRVIREVSMAMEKLPEVDPPSGRVPRQRLLAALILKRRRRRNEEGIGKKGSAPRVIGARGKYRQKGVARGHQGIQAPPGCGLGWDRATRAPGPLVVALWPHFGSFERFFCADF